MVNTFVVAADPVVTARILDSRRLNKQCTEANQIIDSLEGRTSGWVNHLCARGWDGYVNALKHYANVMMTVWTQERGGKNDARSFHVVTEPVVYPPWFSNSKIHYSQMARLLQKDPSYYGDKLKCPAEYMDRGYIWPSKWTAEQLETLPGPEMTEPKPDEHYCTAVKGDGNKCVNKALFCIRRQETVLRGMSTPTPTGFTFQSVATIINVDTWQCGVHKPKDWVHPTCVATKGDGTPCSHKARFDLGDGTRCGVHGK